MKPETVISASRLVPNSTTFCYCNRTCSCLSSNPKALLLQLQTKDLEIKMASIKLQEQAVLVDRAEVQSKKLSEAFGQVQSHKLETDKLLESYNERFAECQHSIEKSNEVCYMSPRLCVTV